MYEEKHSTLTFLVFMGALALVFWQTIHFGQMYSYSSSTTAMGQPVQSAQK